MWLISSVRSSLKDKLMQCKNVSFLSTVLSFIFKNVSHIHSSITITGINWKVSKKIVRLSSNLIATKCDFIKSMLPIKSYNIYYVFNHCFYLSLYHSTLSFDVKHRSKKLSIHPKLQQSYKCACSNILRPFWSLQRRPFQSKPAVYLLFCGL